MATSYQKPAEAVSCAASRAWWVYNWLFPAALILLLPRFVKRMLKRGGYRRHFGQRLGLLGAAASRLRAKEGYRIWIHAVSVGEVYVALRFMEEIRKRSAAVSFVFSTTTPTGRSIAERKIAPSDLVIYFPLDFPAIMRRVVREVNPDLVLMVECEMWPNLLRNCIWRGIPAVLVNGRVSDHSYRNYRRVRFFTRRLLPMVDLLLVQGDTDYQRLLDLGAPPERTLVVGSAKYDVITGADDAAEKVKQVLTQVGFTGKMLLVGGSTWPGEEAALLEVYRKLKPRYGDLRLVLVPRHVERSPEIRSLLDSQGVRYILRSEAKNAQVDSDYDVLLADTTGELRGFYRWADVVFVGKSLTRRGGQNIIEPAQFGCPIITGPNLQNFPVVAGDFRRQQALIEVRDIPELVKAVESFLANPERRREYGLRAQQVVEARKGAVTRSLNVIQQRLGLLG